MPMVFPSSPTVGQVFSSGGRSWVWTGSTWDSPAGSPFVAPGLTLVKSQAVGTGVTSVTVTDAFSATYDNYEIFMSKGSTTNGQNVRFQFSGITGGVYSSFGYYGTYAANTITGYLGNGSSFWSDLAPTAPANTQYSFQLSLFSPFLSLRKFGKVDALCAGAIHDFKLVCDSTTSSTGFTLSLSSGTFSGGTISVYGYRKD